MDVLNPTDADQFLFHYTTRENTLEGIFKGEPSLQLLPFMDTKDPYENKDWNFGVSSGSDDLSVENRIWDASLRLQRTLRVACLTRDSLSMGRKTPVEIRGFGLSRMWDRYGEGHKGFCLAFDKDALGGAVEEAIKAEETELHTHCVTAPPQWWHGEVTYEVLADRSPSDWSIDGHEVGKIGGEDGIVADHLATHYRDLLFKKSKDWEGEREFRHVYWGRSDTPALNVPISGALRAIFHGIDFPNVYLPALQAICPAEVIVYEMAWNWGRFERPRVVPRT